jgi:hypothetical protein
MNIQSTTMNCNTCHNQTDERCSCESPFHAFSAKQSRSSSSHPRACQQGAAMGCAYHVLFSAAARAEICCENTFGKE